MNDGPELYPLDTVKVIPTTKPHGIYFALRYLYEGYNDIIDPWEETKTEADVDALLKNAWQSVPSKFRYGEITQSEINSSKNC